MSFALMDRCHRFLFLHFVMDGFNGVLVLDGLA
jgi:hypothetical protein